MKTEEQEIIVCFIFFDGATKTQSKSLANVAELTPPPNCEFRKLRSPESFYRYKNIPILLFTDAFSFLLGPYLIIIKQQLNGTADTKN